MLLPIMSVMLLALRNSAFRCCCWCSYTMARSRTDMDGRGAENGVVFLLSGGVNWPFGGSILRFVGIVNGLRCWGC